jgi:hypothetical protein
VYQHTPASSVQLSWHHRSVCPLGLGSTFETTNESRCRLNHSCRSNKKIHFCSLYFLPARSRTRVIATGRCHFLLQHGRNPHAARSPDPRDKKILIFFLAFLHYLFLHTATINNNGTETSKHSSPLQFKRQAFDTSRMGNMCFELQGSGWEIPRAAMPAEGLEEE